jgi:hypothetical protein
MKRPRQGLHPVKRLGWVTLISLAVLGMGVVWDNWGDLVLPSPTTATQITTTETAQTQQASADQIEQGRYLALAGNCMACHTTRGGTPFAGGRRIDTPFGGVYSSNLTPDPSHRLGAMDGARLLASHAPWPLQRRSLAGPGVPLQPHQRHHAPGQRRDLCLVEHPTPGGAGSTGPHPGLARGHAARTGRVAQPVF